MKYVILLFVVIFGFTANFTFQAAEVEGPETQNITVSAGACHNMKRDTKYSTPDYQSGSNGYVYNTTHSCEDHTGADGYTGKADMYIEKANGTNVVHKQCYFNAGDTKTISAYSDSYSFFHSSVSWEVIDGENVGGNKVIYSSIK